MQSRPVFCTSPVIDEEAGPADLFDNILLYLRIQNTFPGQLRQELMTEKMRIDSPGDTR